MIFDCDGVLVDSEPISARVGASVLADLGWDLSAEEVVRRFTGCTDEHWRAEVETQLGRPLEDGWETPYESWYEDAFAAELTAVPGVTEAIDDLTVPFCVASNGSHAKIGANLGRVGLDHRFAGRVFSAQDVSRGKPAPDLFLHAAASMGVPPARCVVVEDSPTGLSAARAARMRSLAYSSGLVPRKELTGPGTTVFTDMHQLAALVAGLAAG